MSRGGRHRRDLRNTVLVCDHCGRQACWQGVQMCQRAFESDGVLVLAADITQPMPAAKMRKQKDS